MFFLQEILFYYDLKKEIRIILIQFLYKIISYNHLANNLQWDDDWRKQNSKISEKWDVLSKNVFYFIHFLLPT